MNEKSYQWAIDKLRQETHCTAIVSEGKDEIFILSIDEPTGFPLLRDAICFDEHIVQFIINAVGDAYMEMTQ